MPQLRVFANTGHQFFHLPLSELLPNREESWLEAFVFANRGGWKPWDAYTPWVRYRYAMVRGTPTLKLAIETNLGLPTRGILFDVDDELSPEQPDEDDQVHPYASYDEAKIEEDFGHARVMPLVSLPNKDDREMPVELTIYWALPGGRDPVDVDLVVDLGNTRTVALLLETPARDGQPSFGRRVRALRFLPRGMPFELYHEEDPGRGGASEDELAIIDSFLLLHRPLFASSDPPMSEEKIFDAWEPVRQEDGSFQYRKKRVLPHTFVEVSPALIGGGRDPEGAAKILAGVSLDHEARFSLSSPKRYVWDDEPVGYGGSTVWKQIPNDYDEIPPDFFDDLGGQIRVFMDPDGIDWDIDNPPEEDQFLGLPFLNARPTFPRRDAVCWYALSILEMAHRQINAPVYLRTTGRDSLTRRLCSVRVTYPAGWTSEERENYFAQWERAIKLFTLTRTRDHRAVSLTDHARGGERPVLAPEPLDEAVCSQVPILFADMRLLWGDGHSWFNLYGAEDRCVVMNLDIGGGTTDLAIIEYRMVSGNEETKGKVMGGQASLTLKPKLLFRDGYRVAGDMLVKRIIERIVIPAWSSAAGSGLYADVPDAVAWVKRLFKAPAHNDFAGVDPRASQKMMRIIRLVFMPLARAWLKQLIESPEGSGRPWEALSVADHVDRTTVGDLNALIQRVVRIQCRNARHWDEDAFPLDDVSLKCDRKELESCVDEVFADMLSGLSELVGHFDCHLVFLSGKPSELPRLRELIEETFPMPGQRIIPVKGFPVGSWYPFSTFEGGRIMDAKTCTVVGAALYQDMLNGRLEGFSIPSAESSGPSRSYYWGIVHPAMTSEDFFKQTNLLFQPREYPAPQPGQEEIALEKEFDNVPLNCRIGRQLVRLEGVQPDPVYVLDWKPTEVDLGRNVYVKLRLRWVSTAGTGERLELVSVKPASGQPDLDLSEVRLKLNTLEGDSFWLDDPSLEVSSLVGSAVS